MDNGNGTSYVYDCQDHVIRVIGPDGELELEERLYEMEFLNPIVHFAERRFINMFNKKNIINIVILLILGIVGIPIVIHILFKINFNIDWIQAEWTAGESLLYYGSVLSFIGTFILSTLALWQNHMIKVENDKHTHYLEQLEMKKNIPLFSVNKTLSERNNEKMNIDILNITGNIAYDVEISDIKMYQDENIYWQTDEQILYNVIKPWDSVNIQLDNPEMFAGYKIRFEIKCRDEFF